MLDDDDAELLLQDAGRHSQQIFSLQGRQNNLHKPNAAKLRKVLQLSRKCFIPKLLPWTLNFPRWTASTTVTWLWAGCPPPSTTSTVFRSQFWQILYSKLHKLTDIRLRKRGPRSGSKGGRNSVSHSVSSSCLFSWVCRYNFLVFKTVTSSCTPMTRKLRNLTVVSSQIVEYYL